MEMAPLALSAKVDALSLSESDGLRSAAFASTGGPSSATAAMSATTALSAAQSMQAALEMKMEAPAPSGDLGAKKPSADKKRIFRCTYPGCGREFQLKGNLKRHANIHNGDKKFACKFCGKRFLRKADMEVHYRVHTGEKPYRCKYEDCGKCFARRSDLLSHERTHTGRKPFACAFPGCDRSFARKFDLHKHQRLHEDQADVSGKAKTKKRKLTPRQTGSSTSTPKKLDSGDESCDCPSDVATPFVGNASSPDAALNADVLLPESLPVKTPVPIPSTCVAARRKMSATAACLDTPTRPMRYEMKCPENHIHSPPACLAGLSSLDAFLLSQETLDLSRPFALDAFPPHCPSTSIGTSCCPAHLELRPPPPDDSTNAAGPKMSTGPDMIDQLLSTLPPTSTTTNNTMSKEVPPANTSGAMSGSGLLMNSTFAGSASMGSTLADSSMVFIAPDANGSTLVPSRLMSSSTTTSGGNTAAIAALGAQVTTSANAGTSSADFASTSIMNCLNIVNGTSAGQNKAATEKACLSTPASSLLDYSRHNRSCGHLSIQHGNHRDYVVQNHLVCQDSVTRLGALQRIPANAKTEAKAMPAQPVKCTSPKDTHRPGCGHLPVRHKDHIDYVVEDNLICQQASWLEDDNLELLGDDFWDFYGAIDAFPTN